MMKILRKGIDHDKVFHAQRVMRKAGIPWEAFFMIGFPEDTAETIEETMRLIRRINCRTVSISIFTPYPSTEMYAQARAYGLIEEPVEWRHFSHQSPRNHFVKNIDRSTFHDIAKRCLAEIDRLNARRYYSERMKYFLAHPNKAAGKILRTLRGIVGTRPVPA